MESRHTRIAAAALFALAVTIASPAMDNGFSLDDYNWLAEVSFRSSTPAFLFAPESGQLLNPGARTLWLGVFAGFGLEAWAYHTLLLLLHGTVVLLVWRVASEINDPAIGLLAATLFCAQTAGAEAIFWFAASAHVLVSALVLGGSLGIIRYLKTGSLTAVAGGLIVFTSALLTKGTALAVLPVAGAWSVSSGSILRRRRTVVVLGLGVVAVVVIALNLALSTGGSYLVERGLYGFGAHVVSNAVVSVGTVVLPWNGIAVELGLSRVLADARVVVGIAGLMAALGILIAGSSRLRWWIALGLLSLAPTLPFTMDPTSRYVYLPSAAASVVAAVLLGHVVKRRGLRLALVATLCLVGLMDMRLRDNHFEYRERLMHDMVDGIVGAMPAPPADGVVHVSGLPRLGVDPGIHLEAALQLEWNDPSIRLVLVSEDQTGDPGVLYWRDGRITADTTESPSAD